MFIRLLERHAPSLLLLELAVALLTFFGGLAFTAIFLAGVALYAAGTWLDNYRC